MVDYKKNGGYFIHIGDSLTAAGVTQTVVGNATYPSVSMNHGIGGQTYQQILGRMGTYPVMLTSAFSFSGSSSITVTLSNNFLSTQADNTTRTSYGYINGIYCVLTRTATGTAPSQVETYTCTPLSTSSVTIPAYSIFIPDMKTNIKQDINILWIGRNNTPNFTGMTSALKTHVSYLQYPSRYIILGVLASLNETIGTANNTAIVNINSELYAAFPKNYVEMTPPTVTEMSAIGYAPSSQDNIDISNGVFPTGMRADNTHLNSFGYTIVGNREVAKMLELGYI